MSYKLNKTDGTLLTDLVDGVLDRNTTDIALVGRNYTGFGEFINENFIKLMENFANANEPVSPLRGQLWYDTSENKLKIYDGEFFQSAAGSFINENQPSGAIPGDTWFSTVDKQFYLFDGSEWVLIGPSFSRLQGESGVIVDTIFDTNLNAKTVLKIVSGNQLLAVISGETFNPNPLPNNIIQGLVNNDNLAGTIFKGFNIVDKSNFQFLGTATNALNLQSETGQIISESRLLKNDENGVLNGSLDIRTSSGITIGVNSDTRLLIDQGFTIRNTRQGQNINLVVNSSTSELSQTTAMTVLANEQRIGIFQSSPNYTLDVGGSARIAGDLIVEGNSITIESETIKIQDKNIELAVTESPDDNIANEGGIILKGTTDKTFNWSNLTQSWTSSENLDIANGKVIKHNGNNLLSSTRLYDSVTQATGLTQIGTLTSLTVDTTRIDGSTLSRTSGTGFTFNVGGDIDVQSSKIVQLDEPTAGHHATPKIYVDREIANEPIVFSLDTTGYTSSNDRIIDILDIIYPPSVLAQGKKARVICTNYNSAQVTDVINLASPVTTTTSVEVLAAAGGTASVLQGINFPNDLRAEFSLSISREIRFFRINSSGTWILDDEETVNPINIA